VIVEFLDFQCPYCRVSHAHVQKLIADDPELKVVYRPIVLLDRGDSTVSRDAALMALAAAGQGRYAAFQDSVLTTNGRITQQSLVGSVRQARLNEVRTATDMRSDKVGAALRRNMELAGALGINGTPTYIVGDDIVIGADESALDAAIARLR
jgi:protein-disulfide isomerase